MNKDYFLGESDKRFNELNKYEDILSSWQEKVKTSDFSEVLYFFSNSVSGKQIKESIEKNYIPIDFFNMIKKENQKPKNSEELEQKLRRAIFG